MLKELARARSAAVLAARASSGQPGQAGTRGIVFAGRPGSGSLAARHRVRPGLVETGFHPLDGARYLRGVGVDGQVVSLVAYHSCAQIEADMRGLGAELAAEFSPANSLLTDALLYCDMTTGPDGDYVRPADRLAEIRTRYGPDHVVIRAAELAAPEILTTAGRVEIMLASLPNLGASG